MRRHPQLAYLHWFLEHRIPQAEIDALVNRLVECKTLDERVRVVNAAHALYEDSNGKGNETVV